MVVFDSHTYCAHCRYKGKDTDPCLKNENGQFCKILTQEQKARLSTPSYQEKKKNRDQKAILKESSSTRVDPALVTVVGVAKDSQQSSSTPTKAGKRQSFEESNRSTKARKIDSAVKDKGKSVKKSPAKASKLTTDNKLRTTRPGKGLKGLAIWTQCFCQRLSASQSQCFRLWSYLQ